MSEHPDYREAERLRSLRGLVDAHYHAALPSDRADALMVEYDERVFRLERPSWLAREDEEWSVEDE